MLIKTILATAAAALVLPATASAAPATKSEQVKYCVKADRSTGSRIREVECLTKSEWAQRGVDIDELTRK